jgi:hypothetical protein
MTVRTDDREIANLGIEPAGDRALGAIRRKQPVLVQCHDIAHRLTFAVAQSIARFSTESIKIWAGRGVNIESGIGSVSRGSHESAR